DARLLRFARNDELFAGLQLNAPLKSWANCRVVIGARPTMSRIGFVFSCENAPLWPARAIATRCATSQSGMLRDFIAASACSSVTSTYVIGLPITSLIVLANSPNVVLTPVNV